MWTMSGVSDHLELTAGLTIFFNQPSHIFVCVCFVFRRGDWLFGHCWGGFFDWLSSLKPLCIYCLWKTLFLAGIISVQQEKQKRPFYSCWALTSHGVAGVHGTLKCNFCRGCSVLALITALSGLNQISCFAPRGS